MEFDPSRAVGLLERLFGSRLGKLISIVLVSLACLALAFWLLNVIWTNGGKEIFMFFRGILPPGPPLVTLDNIEAIILTLITIITAFAAVLVSVLYFLARALFKKGVSQRALNMLAKLRNEGIEKVYNMKVSNEDDLTEWKKRHKGWEGRVLTHVKDNFPESDCLRLSHLGLVIPMDFPGIQFNGDHQNQLSFFAKRTQIIEELLNSYRR